MVSMLCPCLFLFHLLGVFSQLHLLSVASMYFMMAEENNGQIIIMKREG